MNWSASVLTTISSDTEPSIVVTFDDAKYIFNAGENISRSWLQSRRHWRKARGIFLTSVGTQRGSGVPGLLMYLADAKIPRVDVVGPQGLLHFLASMRSYTWRDSIYVKPVEIPSDPQRKITSEPDPAFKDGNITLYAIPLYARRVGMIAGDESPMVESHFEPPSSMKRKRTPSPLASSSKRPLHKDLLQGNAAPSQLNYEDGHDSFSAVALKNMTGSSSSPASLRGSEAQEWRRLTISAMFPAMEPVRVVSNKQGKKFQDNKSPEKSTGNAPFDDNIFSAERPSHVLPAMIPAKGRRLPPYAFDTSSFLPGEDAKPAMCYVLVGPRTRGKFDAKKAQALGLQGPLRARVTRGESVTFTVDDGQGGKVERTVHPEDCVAPSEVPQSIMILDVPTPKHIDDLVSTFADSSFYSKFRSVSNADKQDNPVYAIFHLCGEGVLEDRRYQEFMNGFSSDTYHIVSSKEHAPDPVTFTSVGFTQIRLNQLDADMFPVPKFRSTSARDLSTVSDLPSKTISMRSNIDLDIRPPRPPVYDKSTETYDRFHPTMKDPANLVLPSATMDSFAIAKATVQARMREDIRTRPGDDVVVVPLGTSSALPSKYRNVSSTLIQIPNWGNILLDAGEGTWGQLARFFGDDSACSEGVWQALRDLKCVFISHIHGDHHIGLAKILAMRQRLNPPPSQPLYVVGLRFVHMYLRELSELEDLGLDNSDGNGVVPLLADALNWRSPLPYDTVIVPAEEPWMNVNATHAAAADMRRALGLRAFTTVDVRHRTRCYGVDLRHQDGWGIVFSGDTMPTDNLVRVGQNTTLLIHEATMGDDQERMAADKAHSTFGQAIDIGTKMNAKNILLTHFSARYPKMPPSESTSGDASISSRRPTLALAFDNARIPIGDMWKFSIYLPAIEQSYMDTAEIGDEDIEIVPSWNGPKLD